MLTRFEKARVMSARALQLAQGAPILVKVAEGVKRTEEIIQLEFDKGALPLTVLREMPDGSLVFLNMKGEEIGKAKK